jgi:hypothetical protein
MSYTAMNLQPMGKQIVARGGSTDGSSMQVYAQTAGQIGGAAICAATGAGVAASAICAQVGGAIVKIIAGKIGSPATAGAAYTLYDIWKTQIVPAARIAQEGSLAIRAYLTMRDQLIDNLAQQLKPLQDLSVSRTWADSRLAQLGLPGAPVMGSWAPRADLWQAYKDNAVWSKNPIGAPPTWNSSLATPLYPKANFCSTGSIWGYESPSMNQLSASVGLTCADLLLLWLYPMGAPSPPGEPIDWAMVGAWELAQRFTALPFASIPLHGASTLRVARPGVQVPQLPYKAAQPVVTATVTPSQYATQLVLKLQEADVQLRKEAQLKMTSSAAAKIIALQKAKQEQSRKLGALLLVAGAAAAALLVYRRRRAR